MASSPRRPEPARFALRTDRQSVGGEHQHGRLGIAVGPLAGLRLPQVKFLQPLRPEETARVELDGAAPRWRFRVLRDGDGDVLAAGEIVLHGDATPP